MKNRIFLLLLLWVLSHFTYAQIDHFQIGVWSFSYDNASSGYHAGINTTIGNSTEFYRLFKEYGFNTIQIEYQLMPGSYYNPHYVSSNPSKTFLDRADSLGLKIILDCPDIYIDRRIDSMYELTPNFTQYNPINCANGLNYYGNHPAIAGFAVCDEPSHVVFSDIGQCFSDIENYNANLIRLANLLPSYGNDTLFGYPGSGVGAYPSYVEDFIAATHPNILSFDAYPIWFFNSCDNCIDLSTFWPNSFYFNFDVIARASENHHIPFVYIPTFLSAKDRINDTLKNAHEMRYVVYTGLMYGTKGLNYWHAGTNYHMWDKLKTETKEFLRHIHYQIQSHEDILLSLHYKDSYHVNSISTVYPTCTYCDEYIPTHMQWSTFGNDTYTQEIFNQASPITAVSGYSMDSLAISYLFDDNGGKYFWVDNKSFKSSLQIQLNLNNGCSIVDVMNDQRCPQGGNIIVQLLPGEAKLFRTFFTGEADTVSSSITWNQKRVVGQDLVVDSLVTLTVTDTLFIADNSRLIVRPGGKLVVDGGTLTSACDGEMWQGIEVVGDRNKIQLPQYQGTVELKNGAVIENAHCAIHTGLHGNASYATAGGIVLADSAIFRNNRKAVAFVSYTNHTAGGSVANNVSRFTNCTFTVDDDNLFSQENGTFQDHITMWDVRGVKIKGCAFENAISGMADRRHAIYAEDAGFVVDRLCGNSGINLFTCTCIDTTIHCSFSGFSTAIEANTTGYQHPVKVEFAVFRNNNTGVRINGNRYATVTRNDFDMQHNPLSFRFNYGLYMTSCTGYKVEENRFHKSSKSFALTSTGIYVNKSGSASNSIYRNTFDTLDRAIHVTDTNGNVSGGLQMTAGDFSNNTYDIYIAQGGLVSPWQGAMQKGADNTFIGSATYNIYNAGPGLITYYHSNSSNYVPNNVTSNVGVSGSAGVNLKITTLCAGEPIPFTSFADKMDEYTGAVNGGGNADGNGHETLADMRQSLSEYYYEAVRELMSDSVLNLNTLEQWHTAAQPIADPYSLAETRFMEGYAEIFAQNAESDAETANYAEFHAMKLALRDNDNSMDTHTGAPLQPDGHINWYALTSAQITQLQTIAERNTGRSSVMAKGVLCFFFGICYDDEWGNEGVFDTPLRDDDTTSTRAKRAAMDITDDAALSVYPNPADNLLYVELRGNAGIANVALYDLQGRVVMGVCDTPQQGGTATLSVKNVPAGVYLLRVTDADGKEHRQKIVRK